MACPLAQVVRVLDPREGSVALFVSYEPPKGRLRFLQRPGLRWSVAASEDKQGNFVYTCERGATAARDEDDDASSARQGEEEGMEPERGEPSTADITGATVLSAHQEASRNAGGEGAVQIGASHQSGEQQRAAMHAQEEAAAAAQKALLVGGTLLFSLD